MAQMWRKQAGQQSAARLFPRILLQAHLVYKSMVRPPNFNIAPENGKFSSNHHSSGAMLIFLGV